MGSLSPRSIQFHSKSKSVSKKIATVGLLLVAPLFWLGCSGGGGGAAGSTAATKTAAISGTVSGTAATYGSQGFFSKVMQSIGALDVADPCSSGSFTGYIVGGGGATVATGSVSNGTFELPSIPEGREMILTFTCTDSSTQRCLAKSGDAGIKCNPVADAVLGAFEEASGKALSDSAFQGKSIAKLGAAIVQAAQNDGTATEAFNNQINSCKTDSASAAAAKQCYLEAIQASPFAGVFKLMQTMVSGWTVPDLFILMADMFGARLEIDSFVYSRMMTEMDTWLGTNFVSETRNFVQALVNEGAANTNNYVVKIECLLSYSKFRGGGVIRYPPVMSAPDANGVQRPTCINHTAWAANGISAGAYAAIENNLTQGLWDLVDATNSVGHCSSWSDAGNTPGAFCVGGANMTITPKVVEPNRNDPLGERESDFWSAPRVGLVEVFPGFMYEIQANPLVLGTAPGGGPCMDLSGHGPPEVVTGGTCLSSLQSYFSSHKHYFAGMLGLYLFLKSGTASDLSLNDLHKLFTKGLTSTAGGTTVATGYNAKITLPWSQEYCGTQLSDGSQQFVMPVVVVDEVTNALSVASGFSCSNGGMAAPKTEIAYKALLAQSNPPYSSTFQMFEQIPTSTQINSFIFGAGYHTEWNPTGNKTYWAASLGTSNKPIFCKMTDAVTGKARESRLDNSTLISCISDQGLVSTPDPITKSVSIPKGYPYTLVNYGFQGDSKGALFALADAKTGYQVMIDGNPILVYQVRSGNGAGSCHPTDIYSGAPVQKVKLNFGWGDQTQSSATNVYCFDFAAFQASSSIMLYFGGPISDSSFTSPWKPTMVGSLDNATPNNTDILPICYFAYKSGPSLVSRDVSTGVESVGADIASDGVITKALMDATGTGSGTARDLIAKCSESYPNHNKYYLIQAGSSWQSTVRADLKAHLIYSVGNPSMLQFKPWDSSVTNWNDLLVSISVSEVEKALNNGSDCSVTVGTKTCAAPQSAAAPIMNVQLANQKWNAKFDPFCDDLDKDGFCDCKDASTGAAKSPGTCSLLDDAAEPTLSQPPFWSGSPNSADLKSLFEQMGGKAGSELATIEDSTMGTMPFDFAYLGSKQLWFDINSAFACQFKVSGETTYRNPTQIDWNGFGSLHHGGCPASEGGTIQDLTYGMGSITGGGGPIRMVKLVAANNAYSINRPNTLVKLINYATKSVGQGVAVDPNAKVFSFDEALALVALRLTLPFQSGDTPVYAPGSTTQRAKVNPVFSQVQLGGGGMNPDLDLVSAILAAINPDALK